MNQEQKVSYLTTQPIPKLIREMSVPTIISMLVTSFYNMVDTMFVGRIDTQATAAVGVAFSVMALIQAISFLFGNGSGNYISRRLGARDYRDAERMAATGFFSVLAVGAALSMLGFAFAAPLIRLFRDDAQVVQIGAVALRAQCLVFVLNVFSILCNMMLQTIGMAMKASVTALARQGIFFIPLILILPMLLGLRGVQLAQMFADVCSFGLSVPLGWGVLKTMDHDKEPNDTA